jgi:hypothetical protein
MNILDEFRGAGLTINWRTLLIGWDGPGKHPPLLTLSDIRDYATEVLAKPNPAEGATQIAISGDDENAEVRAHLVALSADEHSDFGSELRKWQLVLLKRLLEELPPDPLYGLLALAEFWERFDFPEAGPYIPQVPGATDYFTQQNYEYLIQRHKAWLAQQLAAQSETIQG